MTQQRFLQMLKEELELGVELACDTELSSIDAWDSMAMLNLMVIIDREFNRPLEVDALKGFKTVGDIVQYAGLS